MAPRLTQTTLTFHQHFSSMWKAAVVAVIGETLTGCLTSQPTYLQEGTQAPSRHLPRRHLFHGRLPQVGMAD